VAKNKAFEIPALYADLVRFKISMAVTLSAVTGYFIFNDRPQTSFILLVSGVFLLATGASVLNQYVERRQDEIMARTKTRPLPLEKISPATALIFSACQLSAGIIVLLFIGIVPALLGMLNVVIYNFVYTWLKRITVLAVIPGAMAGAIPPLIGYAAAGGVFPRTEIILFTGFMFLWQLPHFWLILVKYREDYQKAGFKTFSYRITEQQIKNLIFFWVIFSTTFLVYFITTGLVFNKYLSSVLIPLNLLFIFVFYQLLYKKDGLHAAKGAFILVNSFGLLVMLIFIINAFL
jgi:protoheme IX farnesyltransferase